MELKIGSSQLVIHMKFRECLDKEGLRLYASERAAGAKIRLDLTINPLGWPRGIENIINSAGPSDFANYSEPPELDELKERLAERSGVHPGQIMLTAGADQAIEIALSHILNPKDKIGIVVPTFPRFEIVARKLCDAEVVQFRSLKEIQDCKAVCLCTPNNPTTDELDPGELEEVIRKNPETFFIIDAVFSDFGGNDFSFLVGKFDNVAVLKSFSKSFGLPGIRVGWIESREENIRAFMQGVSPFRVPTICQKIALEALKDGNHIKKSIEFTSREFKRIKGEFGEKVLRNSNVPFFLFLADNPEKIKKELLEHGIDVVDSSFFKGAERGFLRIAIGKEDENRALVDALKKILS